MQSCAPLIAWLVLLLPAALLHAVRLDAEADTEGVPILLPIAQQGKVVTKPHKWLLSMQGAITAQRKAEIMKGIKGCKFYAEQVNTIEYMGTKDQLEKDLKQLDLEKDVKYATLDSMTLVIPEVLDLSGARAATRPAGTWGLQRIGAATTSLHGEGVHVFVFDTGIAHDLPSFSNVVMEADMTLAEANMNTVACAKLKGLCGADFHGHGTHIAGIIGGEGVGVAPGATLHSVKVLGDGGEGHLSWVIRGFDHILSHMRVPREGFASQTLIASVGVQAKGEQQVLDDVIDLAVKGGVTVVVGAGNHDKDACEITPANVPAAFTVAAMDRNWNMAGFSNFGSCVNIFAPGVGVESVAMNGRDSLRKSGTVIATAHVAGAMALMLEENPGLTPKQLGHLVLQRGREDAIDSGDLRGSPNVMLHIGNTHAKCKDVAGFRDASGWGCSAWAWNIFQRCDSASFTSYTPAQLMEVKDNCRHACRLCKM